MSSLSRNKWLWFSLFIFAAGIIGALATGWNIVLVRDYQKSLELTSKIAGMARVEAPWFTLTLGTIGFLAALAIVFVIFIRLLKEMRANHLQSEFLAAVTHELKTPIAALDLTSSLLREGGLSQEETQSLWRAHSDELTRLREEVERLLEAARWQSQASITQLTEVSFEAWLETSISRWKMILGPSCELVREGDPLPKRARLDLRTLNLITDNILDNARKYAKGKPKVRIRTLLMPPTKKGDRVRWRIDFQDQGWGFDPRESKRIFQRFTRGKSAAPYSVPGTGLGLFLARTASKAMGVTLKGWSDGIGKGATFTLEGAEKNV